MKTTELLERVMVQRMGQRDLRLGAVALFAHEIRKLAGALEWAASGHGDDKVAAAAQVVMEVEPSVKRLVTKAVRDLRALAGRVERAEPSLSAIDIKPGLVRSEAAQGAGLPLWKGKEADDAVGQAYLAVHSIKAAIDQMDEIPPNLKRLYQTVMHASDKLVAARRETNTIRELARRLVREDLVESVSRYCGFWKASNGKWYMDLAHKEHGDYEDATTYGPFRSEDEADRFLRDSFSNPGSTDSDDSGTQPPPTKSPNGERVVDPRKARRW